MKEINTHTLKVSNRKTETMVATLVTLTMYTHNYINAYMI